MKMRQKSQEILVCCWLVSRVRRIYISGFVNGGNEHGFCWARGMGEKNNHSDSGRKSKFLLEKWDILWRWFFTVTLGINCQYIFVNLGMSPNSSFLPPQGTMLMSGGFWCDRSPGCLATGTSLESGVTVTTRVRGQPDKPVLHTHAHTHSWVCAPHMFLAGRGIRGSHQ